MSLDYFAFVKDLPLKNIKNTFSISEASINPKNIRHAIDHTIHTKLPMNAISDKKPIFIEFIGSGYSELYQSECIVMRKNDDYNWVKNCEFVDSRKLKINFKGTDRNNSIFQQDYTIMIKNSTSPTCHVVNSP